MKNKKLINHVALVIDDSPSMAHLVSKTREVVNAQISGFKNASKDQETLVSVWVFGGTLKNICFDVAPEKVPHASLFIHASISATAVRDAAYNVIHRLSSIPTSKGDHSFLVYIITDGEDNQSTYSSDTVRVLIDGLNDDWTVSAMVPNLTGKHHAKLCGFPAGNIEVWDTTSEKGMEEVGQTISASYAGYSSMRSMGHKSTKSLFALPTNLTKKEVEKELDEVDPGTYETLLVRKYDHGKEIAGFVEKMRDKPYRAGSAYYQLTKPEKIQASKTIALMQKSTGKLFSGPKARDFLGFPDVEVKVAPADYPNFDIFVQSTSTNRHLVADTQLIVFK